MPSQDTKANALGNFVTARRAELELSLAAVAERMGKGVDRTWVHRIEHGEFRNTTPERLQALARALETDVEDLYAIAGITVPEQLPEFGVYLRAKYDLPDRAVDQLDEYFQMLKSKHAEDDNDERTS